MRTGRAAAVVVALGACLAAAACGSGAGASPEPTGAPAGELHATVGPVPSTERVQRPSVALEEARAALRRAEQVLQACLDAETTDVDDSCAHERLVVSADRLAIESRASRDLSGDSGAGSDVACGDGTIVHPFDGSAACPVSGADG